MLSIGNDIVALDVIDVQRTNDIKFYSKILAPSEQDLYKELKYATLSFEQFVWLLWSVKESAYKYLKRDNPDLIFSPTRMVITGLSFPGEVEIKSFDNDLDSSNFNADDYYTCVVTCNSHKLYARSIVHHQFIASFVSDEMSFENIHWGIKQIAKPDHAFQSEAVRALLTERLNSIFEGDEIRLTKSTVGYPIVFNRTKNINIPVSLAHHDHFVAYALQLSMQPGNEITKHDLQNVVIL